MAILKTAKAVHDCEKVADLVETYNYLTGGKVTRFSSLEAGKRRVEMAMLAAKDADAQTGVPPGASGEIKSREEIVKKAKAKNLPLPPSLDEEVKFAQGTLGAELTKEAKAAAPIVPRAPRDPAKPSAPRKLMFAVQATFAGTSKPQPGSTRNSVLIHIQQAKNNACTVEALDKHFDCDTRGYINKLIEKNHLVLLDEDAYAKAKPTAAK